MKSFKDRILFEEDLDEKENLQKFKQEVVKKEEDTRDDLYRNHVCKEEIVIGPTVLQAQQSVSTEDVIENSKTEQERSMASEKIVLIDNNILVLHVKANVKRKTIADVEVETSTNKKKKKIKEIKKIVIKNGKSQVELSPKVNTDSQKTIKTNKTPLTIGKNKKTYSKDKQYFVCETCDAVFTLRHNLYRHVSNTHNHQRYKCDSCDKIFTRLEYLKNHSVKCSSDSKQKQNIYFCDECPKFYSQKSNLNRHKRRECNKIDTSESKLKDNVTCRICDKRYSYIRDLKKHLISHMGVKPFTCNICFAGYTSSYNLKNHMRIHGAKQDLYTCDICKLVVTRKLTLINHIKKHH